MMEIGAADGLGDAADKRKHIPERERQAVGVYPQPGVYVGRGGGYTSGCVLSVCGRLRNN